MKPTIQTSNPVPVIQVTGITLEITEFWDSELLWDNGGFWDVGNVSGLPSINTITEKPVINTA